MNGPGLLSLEEEDEILEVLYKGSQLRTLEEEDLVGSCEGV